MLKVGELKWSRISKLLCTLWRENAVANCDFRGWGRGGAIKYMRSRGGDPTPLFFAGLLKEKTSSYADVFYYGTADIREHDGNVFADGEREASLGRLLKSVRKVLPIKENVWIQFGGEVIKDCYSQVNNRFTVSFKGKVFDEWQLEWRDPNSYETFEAQEKEFSEKQSEEVEKK